MSICLQQVSVFLCCGNASPSDAEFLAFVQPASRADLDKEISYLQPICELRLKQMLDRIEQPMPISEGEGSLKGLHQRHKENGRKGLAADPFP